MGTASTKLKKHLINGDEYAVLEMLHKHPELSLSLNPNDNLADSVQNSALHLAAKFAMKPLIRLFLFDLNGNPNRVNLKKQSALHLVCSLPSSELNEYSVCRLGCALGQMTSFAPCEAVQERRAMCTILVLQWRRSSEFTGFMSNITSRDQDELINVTLLDTNRETALHSAALSGLKKCVQLLVEWNCPLFVENREGETGCDLAQQNEFEDICEFLELKMVFSFEKKGHRSLDMKSRASGNYDLPATSNGLGQQDLQEAKDQLILVTADLLYVPVFVAEALLRTHEWSRETLFDEWVRDKDACCQRAGVSVPDLNSSRTRSTSATSQHHRRRSHNITDQNGDSDDNVQSASASQVTTDRQDTKSSRSKVSRRRASVAEGSKVCGICSYEVTLDKTLRMGCGHGFCHICWKAYLETKIYEGDANNLLCPAFACTRLVQVDLIEKVVSPQLARRFLQFDLNAFVDTNPQIKWCPAPGCEKAVHLSTEGSRAKRHFQVLSSLPPISVAVDCGSNHYFCWDCLGEAHAPCDCTLWCSWLAKVTNMNPDEIKQTFSKTEEAASTLWLVKYSKQCPKCNAHIQKTDGCNHLKCTKCRHDFCWICLEPWKHHSSSTGGYFRCTRADVAEKLRQVRLMRKEAENKNSELLEIRRFVHYLAKYRTQEESYKAESGLLELAMDKERTLLHKYREAQRSARRMSQESLLEDGSDEEDLSIYSTASTLMDEDGEEDEEEDKNATFLSDAVIELRKARRILCGSSVYGFYLEDTDYKKTIFELLEKDLERCTDKLADIVSRPFCQTPRIQISRWTRRVTKKRLGFLRSISKGLVITTPWALRKRREFSRKRRPGLSGLDFLDSLAEDTGNMTETELFAAANGLDPDDPWITNPVAYHASLSNIFEWPVEGDESDDDESVGGGSTMETKICRRKSCYRRRARNPRTLQEQDFCSLKCKNLADPLLDVQVEHSKALPPDGDIALDLLIALELSRIETTNAMCLNRVSSATDNVVEDETRDILHTAYLDQNPEDEEEEDDGSSVFDTMLADLSRPPSVAPVGSQRTRAPGARSGGNGGGGGVGGSGGGGGASSRGGRTVAQRAINFFLNSSFQENSNSSSTTTSTTSSTFNGTADKGALKTSLSSTLSRQEKQQSLLRSSKEDWSLFNYQNWGRTGAEPMDATGKANCVDKI